MSPVFIVKLVIHEHDCKGLVNMPFDERLPSAAALLPCTSELGELVKGIKTSQMPISSSWPFSSSINGISQLPHSREMQLTTESQNRHTSRHLTLYVHGYLQNQLLDALNSASFHNGSLVLLRAGSKVAQSGNCMALDLLVVLEGEQVDERLKETGLDNRGFVVRVY